MCVVLRARVGRLRFVRAGRPLCHGFPCSHCFAHALWRGRSCVRVGVAEWACLWACLLAGGWGLVFAVSLCSRGCLRALVLALWWGGGAVWSRRPCPCSAWLVGAHAPVWAAMACARAGGRLGGAVMVAGHGCPATMRCWVALSPPLRTRGREKREGWGCPLGVVNTRTEREGGSHRPGNCWHGRWRGAFLVVALACSLAWRIQSSSR